MRKTLALACVLASAIALPAHAAEHKKGGGESFIQFQTLTATIMHPDGRRGVLSVDAGIDVPDPVLHKRADQSQPRLRDAYMRFLTSYAATIRWNTPPSPDQIATELQRATDRVLGRPGAHLLVGAIIVN